MRNLIIGLAALTITASAPTPATAQVATYYLDKDFGLAWNEPVTELSAKYTLADAKRIFWAWYARYNAEAQVDPATYMQRNDANFMRQSLVVAAWQEAIWRGHANNHINTFNNTLITCQSRTNITVPAGKYYGDMWMTIGHGQYTGHGSSAFYSGGTIAQGGTEIVLDVEGWLDKPDEMYIFKSSTWGREDLQSYQESFTLQQFRLKGGDTQAVHDPTKRAAGIAVWDMGSVSTIQRIFMENFTTAGLYMVRGTPGTVATITSFRNGLAGVLIEGGGTFLFEGTCEFDENPSMLHTRAGYGRPGWCSVTAECFKHETGNAPGGRTGVYQRAVTSEDGGNYHFGTLNLASVNGIAHNIVYINPQVNGSSVKVEMLHLFGPFYSLLHDARNQELWLTHAPGGINKNGYWGTAHTAFEWTSWNGGQLKSPWLNDTPVAVGVQPLHGLPIDPNTGAPIGTWDNVGSTPRYQYYTGSTTPPPPPTPCTWTTGPWGPCVNGIQIRTVTGSPTGCTGTAPATTQPCTVAPNPCTYTYSAWSACTNGTRTRTVTSTTPAGCTGTPGPLQEACTTPPPSATPDPLRTTQIAVVINSDDPASEAIGTYYLQRRPGARVVRVRLGNVDQQTNLTTVTTARNAISAALPDSVRSLALCFTRPSRVGPAGSMGSTSTRNASITYALTHSFTTTTNMLSRWTSTARTAGLVVSTKQIDQATAAHKAGQYGTQYAISAWDSPPSNPRGSTVAAMWSPIVAGTQKLPTPHQWTDARPLANTNWGANFLTGKSDVIGYWTGIGNPITGMETNTVLRGAIADNVTSYGGRLGEHGGQQSILAFTDAGYLMVTGTVVEPYQSASGNSPGSLVEQFVDPRVALPLWLGGQSAADVYRAAVRCPVRNLGVFDPYVAPYAGVTLAPPSTGGGTPPPTTGTVWATTFSGSGCTVPTTVGAPLTQSTGWACGVQAGGAYEATRHSSLQSPAITARSITFHGATITAVVDWGYLCSAVRTLANGDLVLDGTSGPAIGRITFGTKQDITVTLPAGTQLRSVIGAADVNVSGTPTMVVEGITITN